MDVYPMYHWPLFRTVKEAIQRYSKSYDFKPYDTVSIRGKKFPAPKNPELVLATLYGPEWRTPQANFHADSIYNAERPLLAKVQDLWAYIPPVMQNLLMGILLLAIAWLLANYLIVQLL